MKNLIALALALLAGIALGSTAARPAREDTRRLYAMTAEVTFIEDDSDTVTFTDSRGELFDLTGIEDWMIGDRAILTLDDNGTFDLIDDEIVAATYKG